MSYPYDNDDSEFVKKNKQFLYIYIDNKSFEKFTELTNIFKSNIGKVKQTNRNVKILVFKCFKAVEMNFLCSKSEENVKTYFATVCSKLFNFWPQRPY